MAISRVFVCELCGLCLRVVITFSNLGITQVRLLIILLEVSLNENVQS